MKAATLNQLLVFRAIAESHSIRGAARRLGLSAPSVSQTLRQLEAEVGLPLFKRTTLYAGYSQLDNEVGANYAIGNLTPAAGDKHQVMMAGMRHRF